MNCSDEARKPRNLYVDMISLISQYILNRDTCDNETEFYLLFDVDYWANYNS